MNYPEGFNDKLKQKNQILTATLTDPISKKEIKFNVVNQPTLWRAQTLFTKEPITIEWIRNFEKQSIFFDIGANIGVYSIFSALINSSKVYSFEPESNNFQVLMQNIIANNLIDKVTAFQIGISNKTEFTKLHLSNFIPGQSHHTVGNTALDHENLKPIESNIKQGIFSTTLDDICSKWGFPKPTYIKIDVDGIEHKIIEESKNTLLSDTLKSILIEINENRNEDNEIIKSLNKLGFKYDKEQVEKARRKSGEHIGYAEYLFYK